MFEANLQYEIPRITTDANIMHELKAVMAIFPVVNIKLSAAILVIIYNYGEN